MLGEVLKRKHEIKAAELFVLADLNHDDILTKREMKRFAQTATGAPLLRGREARGHVSAAWEDLQLHWRLPL